MADPVFGQVGVMILMNLDAWEGLAPEQRDALAEAGRQLERDSIARFDELAEEERAELLDLGMEMTAFPQEEAARFETLWSDGVWQVAGEPAEALRQVARDAGLSD